MREGTIGGTMGAGIYGRPTRYEGHICGNCRWENLGREDCQNNITKEESDDV